MNNEVSVGFVTRDKEGNENFILTTSMFVYPNYKVGDKIFLELESDKSFEHIEEMRLTDYSVTEVVHSVRQNLHNKRFSTSLSIDVYVEEIP